MSVAGGNLPIVNRTDRLYALVEELRAMAPRPRSARQLAARYEVSTRTIERDILALQESGVPVYAETGRHGGYVVDKRLTLPPVNFTAAEMVAIAVSLAWAEGTPFAFAARSALRKVLAVAPAGQTAEAAELVDRIRLIKAGPSVKNGPPAGRRTGLPRGPGMPVQHRDHRDITGRGGPQVAGQQTSHPLPYRPGGGPRLSANVLGTVTIPITKRK